jgi:hypothetical protein
MNDPSSFISEQYCHCLVKSDVRELQHRCDCPACYECVIKYQENNIPSPFSLQILNRSEAEVSLVQDKSATMCTSPNLCQIKYEYHTES